MQPSFKRLVLKPSTPLCPFSEAGARRRSGRTKQNAFFCQFVFAGASNQPWMKQEALLARMDPGIHVAVSLGSLIPAHRALSKLCSIGGGSLAVSVASVLLYRNCICSVVGLRVFAGLELQGWKNSTAGFGGFIFEDASFLTCILVCILASSFVEGKSERPPHGYYQFTRIFVLWCRWLYWKSGKLMLTESLSPTTPFAFPTCPCLSGTLWCLPSKVVFNTTCI